MCDVCHGTAMIIYPSREVVVDQYEAEAKFITIGGIDACWKCAEKAEAEYQGRINV